MGYTHGKNWNKELVEKEIKKVMKALNLKRMPSRSECEITTQSTSLSNKISKSGGFYRWAKHLNLNTKDSETKTGVNAEIRAKELIRNKTKLKSKITSFRAPYDLLVDEKVKVEVKFSNGYYGPNGFFYSANLYSGLQKADILFFICENKEKGSKNLIIPSHKIQVLKQLSIGLDSKYDKYIDRYDYIEKFNDFMGELI